MNLSPPTSANTTLSSARAYPLACESTASTRKKTAAAQTLEQTFKTLPKAATLIGGQALCSRAVDIFFSGQMQQAQARKSFPKTSDYDFLVASQAKTEELLTTLEHEATKLQLQVKTEPVSHYQTVTVHHQKILQPSSTEHSASAPLSVDYITPKAELGSPPLKPKELSREEIYKLQQQAEREYLSACIKMGFTPNTKQIEDRIQKNIRRKINDYLAEKTRYEMYPIHQKWSEHWSQNTEKLLARSKVLPTSDCIHLPCIDLSGWLEMLDLQLKSAEKVKAVFMELQKEEDTLYGKALRQSLDTSAIPPFYQSYINKESQTRDRLSWLISLAHEQTISPSPLTDEQNRIIKVIHKFEKEWSSPAIQASSDDEYEYAEDTMPLTLHKKDSQSDWKESVSAYLTTSESRNHWALRDLHSIYLDAHKCQRSEQVSLQSRMDTNKEIRNNYIAYLKKHNDERLWLITTMHDNAEPPSALREYYQLHQSIIDLSIYKPLQHLVDEGNQLLTKYINKLSDSEETTEKEILDLLTEQAEDICLIHNINPDNNLFNQWAKILLTHLKQNKHQSKIHSSIQRILRQVFTNTDLGNILGDYPCSKEDSDAWVTHFAIIQEVQDYNALKNLLLMIDKNEKLQCIADRNLPEIAQLLTKITQYFSSQFANLESASMANELKTFGVIYNSSINGWLAGHIEKPAFSNLKTEVFSVSSLLNEVPQELRLTCRLNARFCIPLFARTNSKISEKCDNSNHETINSHERISRSRILSMLHTFILNRQLNKSKKRVHELTQEYIYFCKNHLKYLKSFVLRAKKICEQIQDKQIEDKSSCISRAQMEVIQFTSLVNSLEGGEERLQAYLFHRYDEENDRHLASIHDVYLRLEGHLLCNDFNVNFQILDQVARNKVFKNDATKILWTCSKVFENHALNLFKHPKDKLEAELNINFLIGTAAHAVFYIYRTTELSARTPDENSDSIYQKNIKLLQNKLGSSTLLPLIECILNEHPENHLILAQEAKICLMILKSSQSNSLIYSDELLKLDQYPQQKLHTALLAQAMHTVTTQVHREMKILTDTASSVTEKSRAKTFINQIINSIDKGWLGQQWLAFLSIHTQEPVPDSCHILKALGSILPNFHTASLKLKSPSPDDIDSLLAAFETTESTQVEQKMTYSAKKKKKRGRKPSTKPSCQMQESKTPPGSENQNSLEKAVTSPPCPWQQQFDNGRRAFSKNNLEEAEEIYQSIKDRSEEMSSNYVKAIIELIHINLRRLNNITEAITKLRKVWGQYYEKLNQGATKFPPRAPEEELRTRFINSLDSMRKQFKLATSVSEKCRALIENSSLTYSSSLENDALPFVKGVLDSYYEQSTNLLPTMGDLQRDLEEIKTKRSALMEQIGIHKETSGKTVNRRQKQLDLIALEKTLDLINGMTTTLSNTPHLNLH